MKKTSLISLHLAFLLFAIAGAGALSAQTIDFSGSAWHVQAKEARVEDFKGKTCLYLDGGEIALPGANFTNGVIEYDLAFSAARGFHGVHWRAQDENNYEEFYVRPHQSGNPDACQYTPVYNGLSGWQLYYGEGYGTPIGYVFDAWMHVKVVVLGKQAEIYVQDMAKPALVIPELKREIKAGGLGLSASLSPVRYANFTYRADDNVKLQSEFKPLPTAPAGSIMRWQVSEVFDGNKLQNKVKLERSDFEKLVWQTLQCEKSGLANLAQVQGRKQNLNTVFAKVTLTAKAAAVKQLTFGYSDIAYVYLNGQLLYGGQRIFQSRDYRYLGTIGYFDSLYLPLHAGDNELIFAVAENFGGWGILAKLDNPAEVAIK